MLENYDTNQDGIVYQVDKNPIDYDTEYIKK